MHVCNRTQKFSRRKKIRRLGWLLCMDNNEHRRRRLSPGNWERIAHDHSNREREKKGLMLLQPVTPALLPLPPPPSTPSGRHLFLSLSLCVFHEFLSCLHSLLLVGWRCALARSLCATRVPGQKNVKIGTTAKKSQWISVLGSEWWLTLTRACVLSK